MNIDNKNEFISEHFPFIIKAVADYTKKYVEVENSEELSIAIEAFNHAIDHYEESRGNFFSFAKTVIVNRLIDDTRKKSKIIQITFEDSQVSAYEHFEEDTLLKHELMKYEQNLSTFDITWDDLVRTAPKHKLTRSQIFILAINLSKDEEITRKIFEKKKLPITEISNLFSVSKKFLKLHKELIIAIVVAYEEKVHTIIQWIENILGGNIHDENRYDC
ncbi:MAG: hypothetical protein CVU84_04320 [Firmicutes bacterium HGW-Firmicutes-1]|jgi:RNA polymerase sigma factor|nr:MAG: hypothetical protein CVU84_04320 [Firmicutes bacterium HGW-Firmicutes-1]